MPQPATAHVSPAPSVIVAMVTLSSSTWIAAEAPMPTLPDFASEPALALSSSFDCAFSVTLPVWALTVADAPTEAVVWVETMLRPSAPAMLTLPPSPPAPDSPSAEM